MCDFLSFVVDSETGEKIRCGDLRSHSKTFSILKLDATKYRECEWTSDDEKSLVVRRLPEDHDANWYRAIILAKFPTRNDLLLEIIPEVANVGGYLYLNGCTGLKSLPENLNVGSYLSLNGCTGLKSLPENLNVSGSLYLDGCTGLKSLPENLKVGVSLSLDGCTGLKSLPENLNVGGYLSLNGCTGLKDKYTIRKGVVVKL